MSNPSEKSRADDDRGPSAPEGLGGIVRRVLTHQPGPEERLEQLLAERRRELAEQAAIVEQTLADLEQREERLRDSRASIERLLRLGQRDLDLRESDLVRLGRELADREGRIRDEEDELRRRRAELGAVELKRAALEQRDRTLAAREAELEVRDAQLGTPEDDPRAPLEEDAASEGSASMSLLFVPGARYRLVESARREMHLGDAVELDGVRYEVSRIGPSPLPDDRRRCGYLVRGRPGRAASGGSS